MSRWVRPASINVASFAKSGNAPEQRISLKPIAVSVDGDYRRMMLRVIRKRDCHQTAEHDAHSFAGQLQPGTVRPHGSLTGLIL